ncbi:hypothetical protein [Streptacidiphilus rugosus]|uniref:hypothetical protein n=1 Tax=Streptacidiphilus rugosus TaxID=405783 RepID=UPI0005686BA7|nr:hypothetical protein [Streptacidiphilus rugosus]
MTRSELDRLTVFLRARLGSPTSGRTPEASAASLRTLEQAALGVAAYFELAAHRPTPDGLAVEEQRARALWQTLHDMAAHWADHPDHPDRPGRGVPRPPGARVPALLPPAA